MSARLDTAAEVLKLARLLRVDQSDVAYLEAVPADELRALRESVTESVFASGAESLRRVAAGAKLIPSPLVATIAQKAFGPLLCARAAGAVDPGKAIDVAGRLPADFLADTTIELDPRRVAAIISQVPKDLVVPVAAELGRRREYVTMGRFLAYVPDHAIVAAMTALGDEALLQTAFVLEHKDRLDHAVGLLPTERLPTVIANASSLGLWPEALDLLEHLSNERRGPVANVVAEQDTAVITELVRAVSVAGIWESLLPVAGIMSDDHRLMLAARPAFHDPETLAEILRAAAATNQWQHLLPLIHALPPTVRAVAANLVAHQDEATVGSLVRAVSAAGLWGSLLPVVRAMDEANRTTLAGMSVFHDPDVLQEIVDAAARTGLWVDLVPLLRALPAHVVARVPAVVANLDRTLLTDIITEAAGSAEMLIPFVDLLTGMEPSGLQSIIEIIDVADRQLGESLISALDDPEHLRVIVDSLPPHVLDAIGRAADRLGLRPEYDAALASAKN
jgi:hypothetical protein